MRQIFVDSRDRSSGTSTDFSMLLPQTLALESGHQGRIDDFRFPNAIPTISVVNNGIHLIIGSTTYYKTLTNGQVNSGYDLANLILAKMNETTGRWDITYDASQMLLTIKCDLPFTFTGGTFIQQLLNRPYSRPNDKEYLFLYVPLQGLDICYLLHELQSHGQRRS